MVTVIVVCVVLEQAACLRFSIDQNGAVRILRDRRRTSSASEPLREYRDCGGNITALWKPARLFSPGYPQSYESNKYCKWIIKADGSITLRFVAVEIEESPGCEYDNIHVLLGPKQTPLGKLCGTSFNKTIQTNTTIATVVFKSDESYEEKGFHLEFFADTGATGLEGEEDECGDTVTDNAGNVTSPNYPYQYPDNSSCWTLINVEPGRIIVMRFKVIALEFDESCAFDYVEVLDGSSEDSPSLGRFCGDSQKRVLRSTSNSVLVHFKSDDLLNNRGFLLQYETNTGGIKATHEGACSVASDSENGTVATPNYPNRYPASSNCLVDLEAPQGARVALRFDEFSLEPDENCTFDFVEVWDGLSDGWKSLGRMCGDKGEMQELVSTETRMRLKFYSDNFSEFKGFKASFNLVAGDDEADVHDVQTVTIPKHNLVPSSELIDEISGEETVPSDDSRILKCLPKVPGAKVTWKKDDTAVLNGTMPLPNLYMVSATTLWIRKMHSGLAGTYTCIVSTEDRQAMATAQVIMVGTKPQSKCNVFFKKSPKDQHLSHGETAIMHCTAQAPKRPSSDVAISWRRNGLPFPTSPRYRDLGNGLVYISDAMPKDSAVYTCVATDKRFNCSVEESALLRVMPRVNIEEICGIPFAGRPNMTKPHVEHGKIVGGMDSTKGAYPWQVMFWTDLRKAFCGGSLLNDQWALTAAHCFKRNDIRVEEVELRLGKYDQMEDEPQQFVTKIADIHFHPNFNGQTFDNDIALVQLVDRVSFTDYILPVCLGDSVVLERDFFSGEVQLGTVTGWGQLTESANTLPRFLQEIRLPIVDHKTCQQATAYPVTRNMFCAGYSQEIIGDACKGDSGGPFVVQRKNRWYIIGIVSWGVGCGRKNHYGYYVKVSNYHEWIKEKILY